jgi:hypothetical protein
MKEQLNSWIIKITNMQYVQQRNAKPRRHNLLTRITLKNK